MIVPMKRLTLIGLSCEKESTLKALQRLGAVQLISEGELTDSEKLRQLTAKADRLNAARRAIKPYYKKPMLSPTPQCTEAQLEAIQPEGDALCQSIEKLEAEQAEKRAEFERLAALRAQLEPFREMLTPLEAIHSTKHIAYILGTADAKVMDAVDNVEAALDTHIGLEAYPNENLTAVVIACNRDERDAILRYVKDAGFNEFIPPKLTGTASENMEKAAKQMDATEAELYRIASELTAAAEKRSRLDMAADAYAIEKQRAEGETALKSTQYAYILDGWARADKLDEIQLAVSCVTDAYYIETRDPYADENPPTATKNKKLIEPFEVITEMYALPSYRGIDAAAVMAPFYFLFFGMMLSDFGYGMLCAPFIGTFFGVEWNDLFNTTVFPLLFDPMTDVMQMMLLSCGLGIVHMYTGIIVKMYMCFRDGDPQSAIFDQLSWMLLLTGLILLFAAPAIKTVSLVLIALGGGMLLLFSGRSIKNPVMRLGKGLSALYNITGYLSDILSYVRIFALGLVSGAMGMVFNLIGGMVYDALGGLGIIGIVIGFILAAALLIALHMFSLFINTLGAFAHTARLQFIEFFGKFYEADGVKFKPLAMNTDTVNVIDSGAE